MPPSTRKRRQWIVAGSALVVVAIAVLVVWTQSDPLRSAARRQWRDEAVANVRRRVDDKAWLESELARLKPIAATQPYQGGWVGDELLVMKNGDWIICQNVCTKERNTAVKKDLFIGRGSNGKWYYSTFHFCVGKCVLLIERQPDSLSQFVDGYWLVPFDGESDESLKVTWDPTKPYGDEKLQSASAPSSPQ
ncbi:MAG TPA: hypothetical protein VF624_06585 [Tepidisphaeraceae bacterium]|jgi:hypothetical protein